MPNRRTFLAGLSAAVLSPTASWAAAGAPDFLSGARTAGGSYVLAGLRGTGEVAFTLDLPGRGHAAAAHPVRPLAVAFARRPGTFAIVLDCASGDVIARLEAPEGRHFYGHGVFSAEGDIFYATEHDYEAGQGVISVWNTSDFTRRDEFPSGGVGPHDIALMPSGHRLVIANGGIETHPDSGRAKLNIPTMRPNLSYFGIDGGRVETVELEGALHKNSIRHLAVRSDGLVAFAMQWQGDGSVEPPLLGLHKAGAQPQLLQAAPEDQRRMMGYAGSVSISSDGTLAAISSPLGGLAHVYELGTGKMVAEYEASDICGLGPVKGGFFFTTGTGASGRIGGSDVTDAATSRLSWDNHLVAIPKPG
ncbi:MAG: DUF1513 domain-containing protein [Paracoccaceae bacterium]